jgi:hypothetical protein
MKSVTTAFDRVIDESLAFGGLRVLSDFWFDEGFLLSLVHQKVYAPLHHAAVYGNTPH